MLCMVDPKVAPHAPCSGWYHGSKLALHFTIQHKTRMSFNKISAVVFVSWGYRRGWWGGTRWLQLFNHSNLTGQDADSSYQYLGLFYGIHYFTKECRNPGPLYNVRKQIKLGIYHKELTNF